MVSAYSFMNFSEYILCLLLRNTLEQRCPYPRLYKSSPIIVYRAAFDGHPLLAFVGRFLVFKYWIYEVVQLSVWPRLRQMFFVDGVDNVCCRLDLC